MCGFNPDFRLVTALCFQSVLPHADIFFEDLQVYLPDMLGTADCYTTNTAPANLQI